MPECVIHLAGFLLAVQAPVAGQLQGRWRGFALGVDPGVLGQPLTLFKQGAGGGQQALVERRIEEHQVEGQLRLALQVALGVGLDHLAAWATQGFQVLPQAGDGRRVAVQSHGLARATGQRFEVQRAATGVGVEHFCPFDVRGEPVEQGLADPVRGRPQARRVREAEAPAAPFAGNDAQLALAVVRLGRFCGWTGH
ncbi:hypothetical protein D3C80_1366880 [compost metagenome]